MSKINRATAIPFGTTAPAASVAEFGSLAASAPVTYSGPTAFSAANVKNIQSVNWPVGWTGAQEGVSSIATEDLNGFSFVVGYQLAYLMQQGVPEYDASTTYYEGSVVSVGSSYAWYYSITNGNVGNAVSNTTYWIPYGNVLANGSTRNLTAGPTASIGDIGACAPIISTGNVTSTSPVAISASEVILTTSGTKPVWVGLVATPNTQATVNLSSSSAAAAGYVNIYRNGGTLLVTHPLGISAVGATAMDQLSTVGAINTLDFPGAGVQNYEISLFVASGSTLSISNFSLVAFEMR